MSDLKISNTLNNETTDIRTFEIERGYVTLCKWLPWFSFAIASFFIAFPFLPDENTPPNIVRDIIVSVFGVTLFGGGGMSVFWIKKHLPFCSIAVDSAGIWPAHLSREDSLIRWADICSIKECSFNQRLELLDEQGNVLIKLEYQLSDFDDLRAMVLELIPLRTEQSGPERFSKSPYHHVFYIGMIAIFILMGLFIGTFNPLLGYGLNSILVALITYEYLKTVSRVEIFNHRIHVGYPIHTRAIHLDTIRELLLKDYFHQGYRHPEVHIFICGKKKPVRIRGLGGNIMKLYQVIEQWLQDNHK